MTLVLDASVALRWFMDEVGSATARSILDGGEVLIAPDLIIVEACNGAWKAVRQHLMTAAQADAMAVRLPLLFTGLHPSAGLAPLAMRMARDLDHPIYDCFYLALAERESATMVSADRRLIARLETTGCQRRVRLLADFAAGA